MVNTRLTKQNSAMVLGNAAELISRIVINVAGNDISTKLAGSPITLNSVRDLALARITNNLNRNVK